MKDDKKYLIKLENIHKFYNNKSNISKGLDGISLNFSHSEFVAITGKSGSGKTTLLNIIAAIDKPDDGVYFFNDKKLSDFSTAELEEFRKENISFVFQEYNLVESLSVLDNVMMPLTFGKVNKKIAKKKALEIIERVGLTKYIKHKATQLSGGQQQRVVIARALAKDSPIIACDEPTGNLDKEQGREIIKLLHEISKDKLVLIVTHNPDELLNYKTREIKISDGKLLEDNFKETDDKSPDENIKKDDAVKENNKSSIIGLIFKYFFSQPKKLILMFLVYFVFGFLISASINLLNKNGLFKNLSRNLNNNFNFNDSNRNIVFKNDNKPFSNDEIDKINKILNKEPIKNARYLEKIININGQRTTLIPLSYAKNFRLKSGRLPKDISEAVVIEKTKKLQYRIDQYLISKDYYLNKSINSLQRLEFKNVGLIDNELNEIDFKTNTAMIVHDDVFLKYAEYLEVMSSYYSSSFGRGIPSRNRKDYFLFEFKDKNQRNRLVEFDTNFIFDESIPEDEIHLNRLNIKPGEDSVLKNPDEYTFKYFRKSFIHSIDNTNIKVKHSKFYNYKVEGNERLIAINPKLFRKIIGSVNDTELNYNISKSSFKKSKELLKEGLPGSDIKYTLVNTNFETTLIEGIDGFLYIIRIFLVIIIFITIIIYSIISNLLFKQIFKVKQRDYNIFRTQGANKKDIHKFIFVENLIIMHIAFIFFLAFILISSKLLYKFYFFRTFESFSITGFVLFYIALLYISLTTSIKYIGSLYKHNIATTLTKGGAKRW